MMLRQTLLVVPLGGERDVKLGTKQQAGSRVDRGVLWLGPIGGGGLRKNPRTIDFVSLLPETRSCEAKHRHSTRPLPMALPTAATRKLNHAFSFGGAIPLILQEPSGAGLTLDHSAVERRQTPPLRRPARRGEERERASGWSRLVSCG
jgi:hypothetical protein